MPSHCAPYHACMRASIAPVAHEMTGPLRRYPFSMGVNVACFDASVMTLRRCPLDVEEQQSQSGACYFGEVPGYGGHY